MQAWFSGTMRVAPTVTIEADDMIVSATPPGDTSKVWFDTVTKLAYYYDGTRWLTIEATPYHGFHEFTVSNTTTNFPGANCPDAQTGVRVVGFDLSMAFNLVASAGYTFTLDAMQQNWNAELLFTTPLITSATGFLRYTLDAEATSGRGRFRCRFTRTNTPLESEYTTTVWTRRYRK